MKGKAAGLVGVGLHKPQVWLQQPHRLRSPHHSALQGTMMRSPIHTPTLVPSTTCEVTAPQQDPQRHGGRGGCSELSQMGQVTVCVGSAAGFGCRTAPSDACSAVRDWGGMPGAGAELGCPAGVISLPYAEIEEPFEAWYNLTGNKSRIQYYGGKCSGCSSPRHAVPVPVQKAELGQPCLSFPCWVQGR